MNKKLFSSIFTILLAISFAFKMPAYGNYNSNKIDEPGGISQRLGLGLGYSYGLLKYGVSPLITAEGRYTFGSGISMYGGRIYYNLLNKNPVLGFLGVEAGYVAFDKDGIDGSGFLLQGFLGGEYFIDGNITFGMDFGPALIGLETNSNNKDYSVAGVEWVVNMGVNYYFR